MKDLSHRVANVRPASGSGFAKKCMKTHPTAPGALMPPGRHDLARKSGQLNLNGYCDKMVLVINMEIPQRKLNRLSEYDYGQEGAYFVTLCTQNRARLFEMELPTVGNGLCAVPEKTDIEKRNDTQVVPCGAVPKTSANPIIHKWVRETGNKFPNIAIDKYVVMPDHLHLIVTVKERHAGCSLPDVMRFFKTMTTNEYIRGVRDGILIPFDGKLWQKSYYDHVIRNQQDYNEVWEYIENNPTKWRMIHKNP